MSRSSFKGPFFNSEINSRIKQLQIHKSKIKMKVTNSTILPEYIGKIFKLSNGKRWVNLQILKDMAGHKFGCFIFTRSLYRYKKNKSTGKK